MAGSNAEFSVKSFDKQRDRLTPVFGFEHQQTRDLDPISNIETITYSESQGATASSCRRSYMPRLLPGSTGFAAISARVGIIRRFFLPFSRCGVRRVPPPSPCLYGAQLHHLGIASAGAPRRISGMSGC
jgi:hypothetical protein